MSFANEPRFRLGAKQNAKNFWQLDATIEHKDFKMTMSSDPKDPAITVQGTLGAKLVSIIHDAKIAFREKGYKIVGDETAK
jgi:hypothetical protein